MGFNDAGEISIVDSRSIGGGIGISDELKKNYSPEEVINSRYSSEKIINKWSTTDEIRYKSISSELSKAAERYEEITGQKISKKQGAIYRAFYDEYNKLLKSGDSISYVKNIENMKKLEKGSKAMKVAGS